MKMTLKIAIALIVLMVAVATTYASVPDVSKWSCLDTFVRNNTGYGVKLTACKNSNALTMSFYMEVSGELIYIHEHLMNGYKMVYYNALKTDKGNWVEVVNEQDLVFRENMEENKDFMISITDDNGNVIAKRLIPLLKK